MTKLSVYAGFMVVTVDKPMATQAGQ